jgi:tetraprenyl-beta-curcumene synthase
LVVAERALFDDTINTAQATRGGSSALAAVRSDRRFLARAAVALVVANARYWSTVAPVVRGQLWRWRERAREIPDPSVRELALAKLDDERFNAEAGAMLATLAPRVYRKDVVEAIVALQVLFDLLDGLTERPLQDPLADGGRLFAAFTDALRSRSQRPPPRDGDDGGYLQALSDAASGALGRLPACDAVIDVAAASAQRAAQAQIRMHAAPQLGIGQLQAWAREQARGTGLPWRELLAGAASSVLSVHALVAAAADVRTTPAHAARIEHAYLSICVLLTLLDSLVDQERDERAGEPGYVSLYDDRELLAQALVAAARRAVGQARELPGGAHHVMMLTGVVAYYTSTAAARGERARPLVAQLHRDLAPLIAPTLAFMRAWRLAKRWRAGET